MLTLTTATAESRLDCQQIAVSGREDGGARIKTGSMAADPTTTARRTDNAVAGTGDTGTTGQFERQMLRLMAAVVAAE